MPLTLVVAAFGPAVAAIYRLKASGGWATVRRYLRGVFDLRLGWRGYILDPMEARPSPLLGNFVLGISWGLWHLPLFFTMGLLVTLARNRRRLS